jgi:hypothetical protein
MMLEPRLVAADILKLRYRPRTLLPNMILAAVAVAFFFLIQKDVGYADVIGPIVTSIVVVGVNIGSMAGSQDQSAGVLRYLVATGRSRTALYVSRVAAAGLVSMVLVIPALTLVAVLSQTTWDPAHTPGADLLIPVIAAGIVSTVLGAASGVGLAAVLGSRGAVGAILTGWYLAVSPLLENINALGAARHLLPSVALRRLADLPGTNIHTPYGVAVGAVALSALALLVLGTWRERRREV